MKGHSKICALCNSEEITLLDFKYQGDWAEQMYECESCGHTGALFYDSVFHLSPLIHMPQTATKLTDYDKKIKEHTQQLQEGGEA